MTFIAMCIFYCFMLLVFGLSIDLFIIKVRIIFVMYCLTIFEASQIAKLMIILLSVSIS